MSQQLAGSDEERLYLAGCRTFVLDGDNVSMAYVTDTDLTIGSRGKIFAGIPEIAELMLEAGVITLTAFIHF